MSIAFSVDPGKNGAITVWSNGSPLDMNNIEYESSKISLKWLKEVFQEFNPSAVVVEDVHTSSRMGVAGAGNFLYSVGSIHTATIMVGAELVKIPPQKWKATMGMYGLAKIAALGKAETLSPIFYRDHIEPFKNRLDRSEALLIGAAHFKLQGAGK